MQTPDPAVSRVNDRGLVATDAVGVGLTCPRGDASRIKDHTDDPTETTACHFARDVDMDHTGH